MQRARARLGLEAVSYTHLAGPTGKTTAMHTLQDAGIPAYEEYQVLHITVGPSSP